MIICGHKPFSATATSSERAALHHKHCNLEHSSAPTEHIRLSQSKQSHGAESNMRQSCPSVANRFHYHYLVNRGRRRPSTVASVFCTESNSSAVIADWCFHNSLRLFVALLVASVLSTSNAVQTYQTRVVDAPKSSSSLSSSHTPLQSSFSSLTQCIIGRLRQCNDDEDCVELPSPQRPQVNVVISSQNGTTENVVHSTTFVSQQQSEDRSGTCTCRRPQQCKRTQQSPMIVPIGESDKLADRRDRHDTHFGWIIATILVLTIVGACGFAIYYYGIRYGMIRQIARQLGLTNNTRVEHQLLNQIHSHPEDDTVELTI